MPKDWKRFAFLLGFLTFWRVPRLREQQHSTLEGSFALLLTLRKTLSFQFLLRNITSVFSTTYWSPVIPYIEPANDSLFSYLDTARLIKTALDFPAAADKKTRMKVRKKRLVILEQIAFASYGEDNRQDVCREIPLDKYLQTVERIASQTKMPDDFKRLVRDAVYFRDGRKLAIHKISFKSLQGSFHFGRIIIKKKKNKLVDLAYSLHTVRFVLAPEDMQVNKDSLAEFVRFEENSPNSGLLTSKGRDLLNRFFRDKAIDEFQQKCGTLLKANEVEVN